jgi:hypothetical protein
VDQRVNAVLDNLFQGDDSFIRLIAKREVSLTPGEVRQSLQRADVRVTFPAMINVEISDKSDPNFSKKGAVPVKMKKAKSGSRVTLESIISAGLIAAPFRLEVTFKKQYYEAEVQADGTIIYQGTTYNSPSLAGNAVVATVGRTTCNGWMFWNFTDTDGELKLLDELRKAFRAL